VRGDWWFGNAERPKGFATLIKVFTRNIYKVPSRGPRRVTARHVFRYHADCKKGCERTNPVMLCGLSGARLRQATRLSSPNVLWRGKPSPADYHSTSARIEFVENFRLLMASL
jgi:hypothetical protein